MDLLHNLDWFVSTRIPVLTSLAFGLSWLGYATFIMFFMAIGYWAWSKAIFFRVMILITISAILNAYAKDVFQSPRPPLSIRLDDLVGTSYGIPSGHAQLAVVIWMWLAYEVRRAWVWVACSVIALAVMWSRLYLAAHYPADVLVGSAMGAATLVMFALIKDRKWFWQTNPIWSVIFVALGMTTVVVTWPGAGVAPDYVPMLAGWLVGGIIGLHFENRLLGFSVSPVTWRRVSAAVAGVVAFIVLQKVLKVLGAQMPMTPLTWEFAKGLVSGIFIALPMPWLLTKLHLAARADQNSTLL